MLTRHGMVAAGNLALNSPAADPGAWSELITIFGRFQGWLQYFIIHHSPLHPRASTDLWGDMVVMLTRRGIVAAGSLALGSPRRSRGHGGTRSRGEPGEGWGGSLPPVTLSKFTPSCRAVKGRYSSGICLEMHNRWCGWHLVDGDGWGSRGGVHEQWPPHDRGDPKYWLQGRFVMKRDSSQMS